MRTTEKYGISTLVFVLLFAVRVSGQSWIQLGADIEGETPYDHSGHSVSISAGGTRIAVGAPHNDGNGTDSGHARIFEYSEGSWNQLGADIDGEAAGNGWSVSLSADGNRVAVGAPGNEGNGVNSGRVRIFEYSGGSWIQLGADIDGEAAGDRSGESISISADGSRVAIGAPYNDGNGTDSGHARIFEYSGGSWNQLGADIDGEADYDHSGGSVSLSTDGSRVAIGAYSNEGNGVQSGHVRVFEYSGGSWIQMGADIDGEDELDSSGCSVSLNADGSRVAIGAYHNWGNGVSTGHVRIFEYSGGSWIQLGADIDGEADYNNSGKSVSLNSDGSRVAIGAPDNDGNGISAGHLRIFEFSGGNWTQLGADIDGEAAGDYSGFSVSLSADGSRVVIGATQPFDPAPGYVRIFELYVPIPDDTDGDGVPDVIELAFGGDISNKNDAAHTIGYITNNTLLTIEQLQDLRAGSSMIEVSGGSASISFNIEASSNLVDWVELTNTTSAVIPADSDTMFFRFRMD